MRIIHACPERIGKCDKPLFPFSAKSVAAALPQERHGDFAFPCPQTPSPKATTQKFSKVLTSQPTAALLENQEDSETGHHRSPGAGLGDGRDGVDLDIIRIISHGVSRGQIIDRGKLDAVPGTGVRSDLVAAGG